LDRLLPLQVRVLDALAEVRKARQDTQREHRLRRNIDVRAEQARIAARVALSTLSASVYFSDLAQAGAPEDTLEVVRGGPQCCLCEAERPILGLLQLTNWGLA
jgi:hypothetical protein